jgi:tetratricopeptide (TPR) repeat protein
MKRLLLLAPLVCSIQTGFAMEADIHEKCLKASDYKGCIEVFSGAIKDQIRPGTQNIKLNIDTQVTADCNQCPSEFAYAGGGYCRRVMCDFGGLFGAGHHPDLAGKGMGCPKGRGQMRWGKWDDEKVRASNNPECPSIQLKKGWQNTCHIIGKSILDNVIDKKYQKAVNDAEKYPKALNIPMTRAVYGSALWKLNQKDESIAQYVQAAEEISVSDANPWAVWIGAAAGLHYQNPSNSDAILYAKKALENEPKLIDRKFQEAIYKDQESLLLLRDLLKRPELTATVKKIDRAIERDQDSDRYR